MAHSTAGISIHFLCIEEDAVEHCFWDEPDNISIHFLCIEEDAGTPKTCWLRIYFNPLPLHRGRQPSDNPDRVLRGISIHFLCIEEDMEELRMVVAKKYFNPLPLHRGRRSGQCGSRPQENISIHFLCIEEDDLNRRNILKTAIFQSTSSASRKTTENEKDNHQNDHFNPLPLHRGRRKAAKDGTDGAYFNPLPLHRGRP